MSSFQSEHLTAGVHVLRLTKKRKRFLGEYCNLYAATVVYEYIHREVLYCAGDNMYPEVGNVMSYFISFVRFSDRCKKQ